jgi:2-polyprenyl-3-methyl-5-hydroxy-6-metoxy-1,4-benzoquinol methylase
MTERWQRYVFDAVKGAGGPVPFALTQWGFLHPVFLAIRRALPAGGRILDVGCGAGVFTALLAHHGYDVLGIDEDRGIVRYAREMAEYFRSPAQIESGGTFDLAAHYAQFDLVYSLGVVEHFEPARTVEALREQARCGPVVVVAVPTRFTRYAGAITDERLYRRRSLARLVRRAGLWVRESFIYGEVPTATAQHLERALPGVLYRRFKYVCSYGMGICCVGAARPDRAKEKRAPSE